MSDFENTPSAPQSEFCYADSELAEEATIRKFRIVLQEGDRPFCVSLNNYSLEAI